MAKGYSGALVRRRSWVRFPPMAPLFNIVCFVTFSPFLDIYYFYTVKFFFKCVFNFIKYVFVKNNSKILYLGAAEGNTVGFLSKVCKNGEIVAIDISAIAMAELVNLAEKETNIIPFLGDAHYPQKYQKISL